MCTNRCAVIQDMNQIWLRYEYQEIYRQVLPGFGNCEREGCVYVQWFDDDNLLDANARARERATEQGGSGKWGLHAVPGLTNYYYLILFKMFESSFQRVSSFFLLSVCDNGVCMPSSVLLHFCRWKNFKLETFFLTCLILIRRKELVLVTKKKEKNCVIEHIHRCVIFFRLFVVCTQCLLSLLTDKGYYFK